MKIYNKVVFDMSTWDVVDEDSFEYDGPLAHCGMTDPEGTNEPSGDEKDVEGPGAQDTSGDPGEGTNPGQEGDLGGTGQQQDDPGEGGTPQDTNQRTGFQSLWDGVKSVFGLAGGLVTGAGLVSSGAIASVPGVVAGVKAVDQVASSWNTLKEIANQPKAVTDEAGIPDDVVDAAKKTVEAGPDAFFDGVDGGAEGYRLTSDGYYVPTDTSEGDERDAVRDGFNNVFGTDFSLSYTPGQDSPDPVKPVWQGGTTFDTAVWDSFADEYLGRGGGPGMGEALSESYDFRRGEAEGLIDTVTGASQQYTGLLDNLLEEASTGTGTFKPMNITVDRNNTMSFVPRSQRELAEQMVGMGRERRDSDILAAKTRYDTIADRDPQAARLAFLDNLSTIVPQIQSDKLKARALTDESARGYAALANEAARIQELGLARQEGSRQFDLNYVERIRQFNETGERPDEQFDERMEAEEPGILDYVIGGAQLFDTGTDLINKWFN